MLKKADLPADYSTCEVVGQLQRIAGDRIIVRVPRNNGFMRRTSVTVELPDDAKLLFESNDYRRASPGSQITKLMVVRVPNGDLLVKELMATVTEQTMGDQSHDEALATKYRSLSDEPQPPRMIRSQHFAFLTDVSDREGQIILDKLETMVQLLTDYFRLGPRQPVEGFIVRDLEKWPAGAINDPIGMAKIQERSGVCVNTTIGAARRAVLYSANDHGVIQHECVHGFCHLTFGSTGPTWLAEGLAEMGQYWKANQKEVEISTVPMSFLQNVQPKRKLNDIAIDVGPIPANMRMPSGTWQDYVWRWALCHLLANNPNYSDRFKPMAMAMMQRTPGVTFQTVYGQVAQELSFEYDQFLQNVDNGYRADLCAWDWKAKFEPLENRREVKITVKAQSGWQPSGVIVKRGVSYDLAASGTWKIAAKNKPIGPDGDANQRGKLEGVILHEFELTEPIPLGSKARFIAPEAGQLYLRCRDDWKSIADNSGEIAVKMRCTP